jgi:hypothetical protein
MGRKAPRKRLTCRVMARPTGALAPHPNVSRRSAHPSFGLAKQRCKNPGAKTRRGNEEVLCDANAFSLSFRGAGEAREPGIHTHCLWLWIPALAAIAARPE